MERIMAIVLTFALILAFVLIAISDYYLSKEYVRAVTTLYVDNISPHFLKKKSFYMPKEVRDSKGRVWDTSDMTRIVVYGNGLIDKGIRSGDNLFYQNINKRLPIYKQIEKGDILLFKIDKIYCCRIFNEYVNNSTILNCYFTYDNGEQVIDDISEEMLKGVIKYKL